MIVFAGGGTGGHTYPALAIAEHLRDSAPDIPVRFLVSTREIDARVMGPSGFPFLAVPAQPFGASPRALFRFLRSWGAAVRASRRALGPSARVVVSTGGFVAAPAMVAARAEHLPRVLVNLDAVPGKATRLANRFATHRFDASGADLGPKWQPIGPLIRRAARASRPPAEARRQFGLDADATTLLITGGSQGASSINNLMALLAERNPEAFSGWQVIHQSGDEPSAQRMATVYDAARIPAHTTAFLHQMGDAWAAADLALCRAGAGTVAEVRASRTPAVFLPYPYHRDDHQRLNALPLAGAHAAMIETDRIDPSANLAAAGTALAALMRDSTRREAMRRAAESLGEADGVPIIAAAISELARRG